MSQSRKQLKTLTKSNESRQKLNECNLNLDFNFNKRKTFSSNMKIELG